MKKSSTQKLRILSGMIALAAVGILAACTPGDPALEQPPEGPQIEIPTLAHISTTTGDLPAPSASTQQTASLILDVDNDGLLDFVIGARREAPSVVWYQRTADGWTRYVIDSEALNIEAGGAYYDIDDDGDLDIVMGGDSRSNVIWWWENPAPDFDPDVTWTRREIKNDGERMHHDMLFADVDGDGQVEFVFWNQFAGAVMLADIPDDPRSAGPWSYSPIFESDGEGLALADIDGDGLNDLLAASHWLKYEGDGTFSAYLIDNIPRQTRIAAADLIPGGRPEVVMSPGDDEGPMRWYTCTGDPTDSGCWEKHELLENVDHGHSLQIVDFNADGNLDIFMAEMRLDGGNEDAGMWLFAGDGEGNFYPFELATGYGNHESRIADLDGDGDLDILGKPYNWETPRLDIWLNEGLAVPSDSGSEATASPEEAETGEAGSPSLDNWQRHVVDADRPWRAVFVQPVDLNGDGLPDIAAGGFWYENPGTLAAAWPRQPFGDPLNNMALAYDFDGDGDMDVLGTTGKTTSATFIWAENDGSGSFTLHDNIPEARGDFLQGVAVLTLPDGTTGIALSWHESDQGVQMLTVPADPAGEAWGWRVISDVSQDEALSAGDIDGDGDADLLLGTRWLRNEDGGWTAFTLFETENNPDRNRLADINGDGRLDAIVGYEAINTQGLLAWYEAGDDPTLPWTEHPIATIIGPMSLDVQDMDGDGDLDVISGEHNLRSPENAMVAVFENVDGTGNTWATHPVYTGDEHHDGTQVADMDGDGDLDIISIGWENPAVLLYENLGSTPPGSPDESGEEAAAIPEVTRGVQVAYTFDEGTGTVIHDSAGLYGLDLTIDDPAAVSWGDGFLAVNSPTTIRSAVPAAGPTAAIRAAGELTLEAWIRPANTTQSGPARIFSLSADANRRNLTLGQGLWDDLPSDVFDVRLRTTETDDNGRPSLTTEAGTATTDLTHVVYTRSADGEAHIYINGVDAVGGTVGGDLSNWDAEYPLLLANESSGNRPWLGELHQIVLLNEAISAEDAAARYAAGP